MVSDKNLNTAEFTIKVTGLRTQTINGIENVVKQVEWTMIGELEGQRFELSQTTTVPDPQTEGFIPLEQLTEAQVVDWVEANDTGIPSIKAHIQYVLDREVEKASLTQTVMPWAPLQAQGPAVEKPVV